MSNYEIAHVETESGRLLGTYVSDAATLSEAIEEAHATLRPKSCDEYLVTRRRAA